jgi:hypothetical protein
MSSSDASFVRPTIPARYLAELLARTGLDRVRTLSAAGLPANATALRKFRASVEQFERLYTVACRACDDEMCGLFAHRVPRGTYAVAIRMSPRSRDLAEFLESFDEQHLVGTEFRICCARSAAWVQQDAAVSTIWTSARIDRATLPAGIHDL